MLRAVSKTCYAFAYAAATRGGDRPVIAAYHRVVDKFDRGRVTAIPSMLITTAMLERHIDWLAKRFTIISLDEMGAHMESPRRFPKPPAAITFDDGYSDFYHHAFPLFKRKGVPAAIFVVTGLIGTRRMQIFDRLYLSLRNARARGLGIDPFQTMTAFLNGASRDQVEQIVSALERDNAYPAEMVDELAPLSWDMITTMDQQGITIGSHTASHVLLTSEKLETVNRELRESKQTLESCLKKEALHFAYPDGRFDPAVVQAVHDAGYRYAYGICRTQNPKFPLLTIPRRVMWERACINPLGKFSPAVMKCQVNWVFKDKKNCGHDHERRIS